jgi:hypothetical protein
LHVDKVANWPAFGCFYPGARVRRQPQGLLKYYMKAKDWQMKKMGVFRNGWHTSIPMFDKGVPHFLEHSQGCGPERFATFALDEQLQPYGHE